LTDKKWLFGITSGRHRFVIKVLPKYLYQQEA
jgi:hypothetical protein